MNDRPAARLRDVLTRRALPPAPSTLHRRLEAITSTTPDRSTPVSDRLVRPRLVLGLAAVLAGTLAVAILSAGGDRSSDPSAPSEFTTVDGLPVLTVSAAIAARDAGDLPDGRVAIRGFWFGSDYRHSCPAPGEPVGDLEIYCRDGEYGITERRVPMLIGSFTSTGSVVSRQAPDILGPSLTPWITPGLEGIDKLTPPIVDGQFAAPVPIIVVGHFGDPRAAECQPEMEQVCRERLVLDRIVLFGSQVLPTPLVPPGRTAPPMPQPSEVLEVDGLLVMTVSEAVAAHQAGSLPDGRVAIRGYWSNGQVPHTCVPPPPGEQPGELELRCSDGEFGITERDEPILVVDVRRGQVTYTAQGPHLTPWFPEGLDRVGELFTLPFINGQWYPPVPILVLGHFDDPRAEDCRPDQRELCRNRLVIDRIVRFDIEAVPTPGVTPSPTPFPSPPPPGLFEPEECAGDVPYTFVGWSTAAELGIPLGNEGHLYAAISRDPVDRSGEWGRTDDGHRFRLFARVICFRAEYEGPGSMSYDEVPGTEEVHWEDGLVTPGWALVRASGSP